METKGYIIGNRHTLNKIYLVCILLGWVWFVADKMLLYMEKEPQNENISIITHYIIKNSSSVEILGDNAPWLWVLILHVK